MASVVPQNVRNVVLAGPGAGGKKTLAEELLFRCKAIAKKGSVEKGDAVMITEAEDASRQTSITVHTAYFSWKDHLFHLFDTPGYFSFLENLRSVVPVADGALLVVSGMYPAKPETSRIWQILKEAGIPMIGFISGMDDASADFGRALSGLKEGVEMPVLPVQLPVRGATSLNGVVDLVSQKAFDLKGAEIAVPAELKADVETYRLELIEKIAEASDELIEKYLGGASLSEEELRSGLRASVLNGSFIPVFCGSGMDGTGVEPLLTAMIDLLPSPVERDKARPFKGTNPDAQDAEESRANDRSAPFSAFIFKTTIDPFSGKVSVFRVCSGSLKPGDMIYNPAHNLKVKAGHLFKLQGKDLVETEELSAGEIGALVKINENHTGDTLCVADHPIVYPQVKYAEPSMMYAVEAEKKSEEKASSGLQRLAEEDPTLRFYRNPDTAELILAGMGQQHVEVALERLHRKFGASAKLHSPQVPYRETIRRKVNVEGKVKKQTGGHGQFADCWIDLEPTPRDSGFVFEDCIVGGAIPRQFIPSVEKGIRDTLNHGVLGGFPVVDVKVSLVDGKFHAVDSSDFAFQTAGSIAFKDGMAQADPVLLEPIMHMEISVPEAMTGDVLKDLSGRRGRVQGMNSKGTVQTISAEAPMSEVLEYGNVLNGITSGQGTYVMQIASYKEVPDQIATRLLEALRKKKEAAKEE